MSKNEPPVSGVSLPHLEFRVEGLALPSRPETFEAKLATQRRASDRQLDITPSFPLCNFSRFFAGKYSWLSYFVQQTRAEVAFRPRFEILISYFNFASVSFTAVKFGRSFGVGVFSLY